MINSGRKSFTTRSANLLKMCPGSMECYEQDNIFFEQDSQGMQVSQKVQGGMQLTEFPIVSSSSSMLEEPVQVSEEPKQYNTKQSEDTF